MTPDVKQQVVSDVLVLRVDLRNQQPLPLEVEAAIRQAKVLINLDETRNIVLNLSGIRYVNSTVLEILVNQFKELRTENRQLRLCCLDPELADVMSTHYLDHLFFIDDTEEQAVASVGSQ